MLTWFYRNVAGYYELIAPSITVYAILYLPSVNAAIIIFLAANIVPIPIVIAYFGTFYIP